MFRKLVLTLSLTLFAGVLALMTAPSAWASDNCCGAPGRSCSAPQDWQSGWEACNNNACPGFAGCAKGASATTNSGSSSGGSSSAGNNICGPGGAAGCTGQTVGTIITAGTERLRCFKQTASSPTCGRQYVDSAGNYTSGSDNTSQGSKSGEDLGQTTPTTSGTTCVAGSAEGCTGQGFGHKFKVGNSLLQCVKRESSNQCKRVVLTDNAGTAELRSVAPDTNQGCQNAQSLCRQPGDTCRQAGGGFRCLPTSPDGKAIAVADLQYKIVKGRTDKDLSCVRVTPGNTSCTNGGSCYADQTACAKAIEERLATLSRSESAEGQCVSAGKAYISCNANGQSTKHCVDKIRAGTFCQANPPGATTQTSEERAAELEKLKQACTQQNKLNLSECLDTTSTEEKIIKSGLNGVCGQPNTICTGDLQCLTKVDSPNGGRTCQKPPEKPTTTGSTQVSYFAIENQVCVRKTTIQSNLSTLKNVYPSQEVCTLALTGAPPTQFKIVPQGDAQSVCRPVQTALECAVGEQCFETRETCLNILCQLNKSTISCELDSQMSCNNNGVASCGNNAPKKLKLGDGFTCPQTGGHTSCLCTATNPATEISFGQICKSDKPEPTAAKPNNSSCRATSECLTGSVCQFDAVQRIQVCKAVIQRPVDIVDIVTTAECGPSTLCQPGFSCIPLDENGVKRSRCVNTENFNNTALGAKDLQSCVDRSDAGFIYCSCGQGLNTQSKNAACIQATSCTDYCAAAEAGQNGAAVRYKQAGDTCQRCASNDPQTACTFSTQSSCLASLPNAIKIEGKWEQLAALNQECSDKVACADGLVCLNQNDKQTCQEENSRAAFCTSQGPQYSYCSCNTVPGAATAPASCIVRTGTSCAAYCALAEQRKVGVGQTRYKLAFNNATCQACTPGESLDVCRYVGVDTCNNERIQIVNGQKNLGAGDICQDATGALHNDWCSEGYTCDTPQSVFGTLKPATCIPEGTASVSSNFENRSCASVINGTTVADQSKCRNLTCVYDGAVNDYRCKADPTQATPRNIGPTDTQRTCAEEMGCTCEQSNGAKSSIRLGSSCPIPTGSSCPAGSQPLDACGDDFTGSCMYVGDSNTLTCSTAVNSGNFLGSEGQEVDTCSTRLCSCGSNPNNKSTTFCAANAEQSCQALCTQRNAETFQQLIRSTTYSPFVQNVQKGWNTVTLFINAAIKTNQFNQAEAQIDQSLAQLNEQLATQGVQSENKLARGADCLSGNQCQSGICARLSNRSDLKNGFPVCVNFTDLAVDNGSCFSDASCKSGKCNTDAPLGSPARKCIPSTYRSPQIFPGQQCSAENSLSCVCRRTDGTSIEVPPGQTCKLPPSFACDSTNQCDNSTCQQVGNQKLCTKVQSSNDEIQAALSQRDTKVEQAGITANASTVLLADNAACSSGVQCQSGFCIDRDNNSATAKLCTPFTNLVADNQSCQTDGQCQSGQCEGNICINSGRKSIFPGVTCDAAAGCQCRGDDQDAFIPVAFGSSCVIPQGEICSLSEQCSIGLKCLSIDSNDANSSGVGTPITRCLNPNSVSAQARPCVDQNRKFCENKYIQRLTADPNTDPNQFCISREQACSDIK